MANTVLAYQSPLLYFHTLTQPPPLLNVEYHKGCFQGYVWYYKKATACLRLKENTSLNGLAS